MSLIGSLEQFDLGNVLRRIEVFAKTGVIIVKQQEIWVEFYFRRGQLICIGPMRTNVTLIDRLLQAQLISSDVLPQVLSVLSSSEENETHIAMTLINEGYLNHEMLRTWSAQEASRVLQAVFSWPTGEISFEEDSPAPTNRLLVALSVSSLLDALSAHIEPAPPAHLKPASVSAPSTNDSETPRLQQPVVQPQPAVQPPHPEPPARPAFKAETPARPSFKTKELGKVDSEPLPEPELPSGVLPVPSGLLSASELIDDLPFDLSKSAGVEKPGTRNTVQLVENTPAPVAIAPGIIMSDLARSENVSAAGQSSLIPPQPIANPLPPRRIDTSFMTPELVLVHVDLSSLRGRNPQVQLTPEQWRLFALIDGQTSLQGLCQVLMMQRERVCAVAGELIALGLMMPLTQTTGTFTSLPSGVYNTFADGLSKRSPQTGSRPGDMHQPAVSRTMPPSFMAAPDSRGQWSGSITNSSPMSGDWAYASRQSTPPRSQMGPAYVSAGGYR